MDEANQVRRSYAIENEELTEALALALTQVSWLMEENSRMHQRFQQMLSEVAKMEYDHNADLERKEVKISLLEETLTKRNEIYNKIAKEHDTLTKLLDSNDKARAESEKKV